MPAVITLSRRPWRWAEAAENILRQTNKPEVAFLGIHLPREEEFDYSPTPWLRPLQACGIVSYAVNICGSRTAGAATNELRTLASGYYPGLVCVMDDDDWYGPNYLEAMNDSWRRTSPDHLQIFGKSGFTTRWMDGPRLGKTETFPGAFGYLAGPTFSISGFLWHSIPQLRYPNVGQGCDQGLLQILHEMGGVTVDVPEADFFYQRFDDPKHKHDWKRHDDPA